MRARKRPRQCAVSGPLDRVRSRSRLAPALVMVGVVVFVVVVVVALDLESPVALCSGACGVSRRRGR